MSQFTLDIELRVAISLAVSRYQRSLLRLNDASREFTEACNILRKRIGPDQRFVVQSNFKHYLVTSDGDGDFEMEEVLAL